MRNNSIFLFSAVVVLLFSCSGFEKTLKSDDYQFKLSEAKRYYAEEDYYRAQTLYDQIAPVFRGTNQADTIYFYQAMSYFQERDYIMAGHLFEMFTRTYGASDFVEQADFMKAYCHYMNSPRPELDQSTTAQAIQAFHLFIIRHPGSDKVEECRKYIAELEDKLVEKSFISARLYYDLGDYKASLIALNNSILEYPESKHREELMFMVLKSSYMLADRSIESKQKERFQATIDEYYSFKAEYTESEFIREADKYYRLASKFLGNEIVTPEEEIEIN